MKVINNIWRNSMVSLFMIGMACNAIAQNVVFTAQASANKMGAKDNVQVEYTIKDAQNVQTMTPPAGNDFDVVQGPYTTHSVNSSFNGRTNVTSESITRTYILHPRHEGTLTIPPVIAKDAAGHTYQSNAVVIQVVPGTLMQQQRRPAQQDDDALAMMQRMNQQMQQLQQQMMQPQPQQPQQPQQRQQQPQQQTQPDASDEAEIKKNMFIKVEVDKTKVHVGEQITTSYKLYVRDLAMNASISKLPSLNGFWTILGRSRS